MKKRNIIVLITLLIIIIGAIVYFVFFKDNGSTKKEPVTTGDAVYSLLSNDYMLYYLKSGYVKVDEDTATEMNGKTYYIVNEDKIKRMDDIVNLIKNTYTKESASSIYNDIFKDKRFMELDDALYISQAHNYKPVSFSKKDFAMTNVADKECNFNVISIEVNAQAFKTAEGWRLNYQVFK